MKRLIILLILMIIVVMSGCIGQNFTIGNRETPTTIPIISDCINNEKKHAPETYVRGEIIIGFRDDTTKETAMNLIQTNGLTIKDDRMWSLHALIVKVPEGSEINWVCQLKNYDNIKYTELNGIVNAVD